MEIHEEWIKTLFRKGVVEESIQRIISIDYKKVVADGNNHTSDMKRIQMKVILGSGEIANKTAIVKRKPDGQVEGRLAREYPLFQNEIEIYANVSLIMEELMREKDDNRDTILCQCFGHLGNEVIVLEDLKESGYRILDRVQGLDLSHSIASLSTLGRYHAMSYVLSKKNKLSLNKFDDYIYVVSSKIMNKITTDGFKNLVDVMRSTWGKEWESMAEMLEKKRELLLAKARKLLLKNENAFNVLNHGDCWTNNIMFKYDLDTNEPISVKLIDFQLSHYNYYCWDIIYFIYTSVRREVRKNHLNNLLEAYRNSVKATLKIMGSDIGRVPTLDEMKQDLNIFEPYAIIVDVAVTPILMAAPVDKWDLNEVVTFDEEVEPLSNKKMYLNEKYKEALQYDLKHFNVLHNI